MAFPLILQETRQMYWCRDPNL